MQASAEAGAAEKMGYRPELDALRALACAAVFVHHAGMLQDQPVDWLPGGGWVGVTAFFTLSGYLITTLLLEEQARGPVSLGGFYLRRARRLLPALFGLLAVSYIVAAVTGDVTLSAIPWAGGYVGNFNPDMGWLGHTWSLAVEEHFYLLWPLVFVASRRLLPLTVVLAGCSMLWRLALALDGAEWVRLRNTLDVRAEAILIGCALAVLVKQGFTVRVAWWLPAVGLVPLMAFGRGMFAATLGYSLAALLTAGVIGACMTRPPVVPSWLAGCGKVTYGFYLWHYPVLIWMQRAWDLPPLTFAVVALGFSVAATWLSWVLVERRWLQLGVRGPMPERSSSSRGHGTTRVVVQAEPCR